MHVKCGQERHDFSTVHQVNECLTEKTVGFSNSFSYPSLVNAEQISNIANVILKMTLGFGRLGG